MRRREARAAVALALGLGGCNVGPPYERPSAPVPRAFREDAPAAYRDAQPGTWRPARPEDAVLKGKWWTIFHEAELDSLEDQLDIGNQTIAQYFENFMAARAQVDEARAGYYPTVSVAPSYTRTGSGGGSGGFAGPTTSSVGTTIPAATAGGGGGYTSSAFYTVPVDASWAPDLFQRVRNSVRQFQYAAQVSAADLENERLLEQASLAQFYFELRGQDAYKELYDRTIAADREVLEYNRAQYETGIGGYEAVAQAEVTLQTAVATAVGIATNRAVYEHAIATLVGKPASELTIPFKTLATPVPDIPVGVPTDLLERRPDVAAAERAMASANALIGVGRAAYFPTLNLSASGGFASSSLGSLFSAPSLFWSLGATAAETVFEGGLRRATVRQYEAQYRADVAAYRQVVLTAVQQVEDGLSTLRILSEQITRQEVAVKAARTYLEIALASWETGVTSYLDVTTAQNLLLSDEQTLVTLRVNQMTAAVSLVQALGGGWDVRRLPAP